MAHQFTTSYIRDAVELFHHYKKLADRAIAQCPEEQFGTQLSAQSNSIATIVKHLSGNMRSRWTDFLTTDGEKASRKRDTEFEEPPKTRAEIDATWEQGWRCLFEALAGLSDADLSKTVTIRTEPHSVMQAINRQTAHCAYHIGQIIYLAKIFADDRWQTLTVPKKKSEEFNARVASGELSQR